MTHLVTKCQKCNATFHYTETTSPVGRVICCGEKLGIGVPYVRPQREALIPYRRTIHPGAECWQRLHNYALSLAHWDSKEAFNWFDAWQETIPSIGCDCRKHWRTLVEANPPDFGSPLAFFVWTVARHNDVNKRLGKPEITIDEACRLYGWP